MLRSMAFMVRRANGITVRVPGSTSNLGSGFDTLGLAVNLSLTLSLTPTRFGGLRIISFRGEGTSSGALRILKEAVRELGLIKNAILHLSNEIPVGHGLGASAALRIAMAAASQIAVKGALDKEHLLQSVTALEGHPDNVTPALFGGFTVSGLAGGRVHFHRFGPPAGLRLVTLIPPYELPTAAARRVVPGNFSKADTAHILNRAAMIVAAFSCGNPVKLAGFLDDRFHQPSRARLVPELVPAIELGTKAGAIGGFLSGAGSGVILLVEGHPGRVHRELADTFPGCRILDLRPVSRGLTRL